MNKNVVHVKKLENDQTPT